MLLSVQSLGGHVMSLHSYSDLNPILAVGQAALHLRSEGKHCLKDRWLCLSLVTSFTNAA